MSQFSAIITTRNVEKHNGWPLWKYNLSDVEFNHLHAFFLQAKSLNNVDPRDCTLFYAEWWKRNYNGGFPSKKDVFASISNKQYFGEEDFYKNAKIGARLLGIKWIKIKIPYILKPCYYRVEFQ